MLNDLSKLKRFVFENIYYVFSVILICFGMSIFFIIMKQVRTPDELVRLDLRINNYIFAHRSEFVNLMMKNITHFADTKTIFLGVIIWSLYFYKTKHWNALIAFIISVGGGQLFVSLVKLWIKRERPSILQAIASENTFSFPSGHTFMAVCFYGFLAYYFIAHELKSYSSKVVTFISSIILILTVGFSRVYLGVHWMSDVLGSLFAGSAWIICVLSVLEVKRKYFRKQIPD